MEAICNNHSCTLGKSLKVFQVKDLSSSCPSCGLNDLLPKSALNYKKSKEHVHHEKLEKSKSKINETLSKSSAFSKTAQTSRSPVQKKSNSKSLKSIEMSYHQKLSKLSSSIKNDKLISKFSKIDDDIITGNASLKELNKELKKIDGLFNDLKNVKEPSLSKSSKKKNTTPKYKNKPKKVLNETNSGDVKTNVDTV